MLMETELIEVVSTQGLGAVLSVALLFYIIRTQKVRDDIQNKREEKYQNLLTELTKRFDVIKDIQKELNEIKEILK